LIRDNGKDGFYKGETAALLIKQIQEDGGYITQNDLDNYHPVERIPVTGTYRGYEIVSMPPPSSGGIAVIQMLNILENYKFQKNEWGSSTYIHRLVESMKYAFADRTRYLGDADFVKVPVDWLTSKKYAHDIYNKIKNLPFLLLKFSLVIINPGMKAIRQLITPFAINMEMQLVPQQP
jgi:gamma-glutamyltranspeptidase/glutathione hydrolase